MRRLAWRTLVGLGPPVVIATLVYWYAGSHAVLPGIEGCRYVRAVAERSACYERRIRGLVDGQGLSPALRDVARLAARDPLLRSGCHQALHVVGERDGRARARAGAPVVRVADATERCQQGYLHGQLIGYAREQGDLGKLGAGLVNACIPAPDEPDPSFERNCTHAYGHLFVQAADLRQAVVACGRQRDRIATVEPRRDADRYVDTCIWGALMEDAFEVVGGAGKAGARSGDAAAALRESPARTCRGLEARAIRLCHAFLPARAGILGGDERDAAALCNRSAAAYRNECVLVYASNVNRADDCDLLDDRGDRRTCRDAAARGGGDEVAPPA